MYFSNVEVPSMGLKPMNCPAHVQIYKLELRSYRDLPIRYAEQGLVHRHEPSGSLHGLLRVRHITQDDAHVFCTEDQIQDEIDAMFDYVAFLYDKFGVRDLAHAELSTRPDNRLGTDAEWDHTEGILRTAIDRMGLPYKVAEGERAETVGKRIRDAELEKIPYVIVYGDKESDEALAVRQRGGEQATLSLEALRRELATL